MTALDTTLRDATTHSGLIATEEHRLFQIEGVRYLAVPLPSVQVSLSCLLSLPCLLATVNNHTELQHRV
jgi:hypothetical protein